MFSPDQVAILLPTKDRPEQVRTFLKSLQSQHFEPGQIIVIASGMDISQICYEFPDLKIDYQHVPISNQIRQRVQGIKSLKDSIQLVCLMDDDVVLLSNALHAMLSFWNQNPHLAAVNFNIMNEPPFKLNLFKYIFGMTGKKAGTVTRAGYNTKITHVDRDMPVEWVIGGMAVWKKAILKEYPYENWDTVYPLNEDIYYSFPIGRKHPFAVSASAKVEHRRVYMNNIDNKAFGTTQIHALFRLVRRYPCFSVPLAYWGAIGQALENLTRAILKIDKGYLMRALGNVKGIFLELK